MSADVRFTVEVATRGSNAREHFLARQRRVELERRVVALTWRRIGLGGGVPGLLQPDTVLRFPVGVSLRDRKLAKLAGHDLRRVEAVAHPAVPIDVHLTRVSFGSLDPFENLPVALKGVVDELAHQMGVNDRDPIVRWVAHQEHGARGYHAVRIRIVAREPLSDLQDHERRREA